MHKLITQIFIIFFFLGCSTLTYYSPRNKVSSIMLLDPSSDVYAYVNLSKNRFIYDDLDFKYKIGVNSVGNLYFSYTKDPESFSSVITGNFPKNIFWGMQNNSNFKSKGNILTNPKWQVKNSNVYITPTKDKTGILINQREITHKNENILTTQIDTLEKNEMFLWIRDVALLLPNNISKKNLIPFNSATLVVNSTNAVDYHLKAYLTTNNPTISSILSKKLIPILLENTTKIIISSPIKSRVQDRSTVELEFSVEKTSVKEFVSTLLYQESKKNNC
ncbi:hypothetical protein LKV13_04275 [Borrelia sp. BU AG58]|uniref:hypothetical protein n=1 Tax=Borrelia sp. BU AG58 TaxID=2887345 RepID=UPI001E44BF3E|nr:hypothetical protein [Borrelia sp. BU AG58]UER67975.1 hypothetical protein LKV13_04275 [Borrelia sp. BU AG58]